MAVKGRAVLRWCLAVSMCLSQASTLARAEEPQGYPPVSKAPLFAKLCLGADEAKAALLMLDESKGTGTGYDTLRIEPVGFEIASRTIAGKVAVPEKLADGGRASFKRVVGPIPLAEFAKAAGIAVGGENPVVVSATVDVQEFVESKHPGVPRIVVAAARMTLWARNRDGTWEYRATQVLELAKDPAAAVLHAPATRPDFEVMGELDGNDLSLAAVIGRKKGALMITSIRNNGKPMDVQMTVRDGVGTIVGQLSGSPEDFLPAVGPELALRSKMRVPLPKRADYRVEASVNAGALGGVLSSSTTVPSGTP
jgi:hypothetical protein